jgi:hypothetical protein
MFRHVIGAIVRESSQLLVYGCLYPLNCTRDHLVGATLTTENTPWWWQLWRAETCRRFTNVWCVLFGARKDRSELSSPVKAEHVLDSFLAVFQELFCGELVYNYVKLFLCLIRHHNLKKYGRMKLWLHIFWTSVWGEGEWSVARPDGIDMGERAAGAHWYETGWVSEKFWALPRAVKSAVSCLKRNPHFISTIEMWYCYWHMTAIIISTIEMWYCYWHMTAIIIRTTEMWYCYWHMTAIITSSEYYLTPYYQIHKIDIDKGVLNCIKFDISRAIRFIYFLVVTTEEYRQSFDLLNAQNRVLCLFNKRPLFNCIYPEPHESNLNFSLYFFKIRFIVIIPSTDSDCGLCRWPWQCFALGRFNHTCTLSVTTSRFISVKIILYWSAVVCCAREIIELLSVVFCG